MSWHRLSILKATPAYLTWRGSIIPAISDYRKVESIYSDSLTIVWSTLPHKGTLTVKTGSRPRSKMRSKRISSPSTECNWKCLFLQLHKVDDFNGNTVCFPFAYISRRCIQISSLTTVPWSLWIIRTNLPSLYKTTIRYSFTESTSAVFFSQNSPTDWTTPNYSVEICTLYSSTHCTCVACSLWDSLVLMTSMLEVYF